MKMVLLMFFKILSGQVIRRYEISLFLKATLLKPKKISPLH